MGAPQRPVMMAAEQEVVTPTSVGITAEAVTESPFSYKTKGKKNKALELIKKYSA